MIKELALRKLASMWDADLEDEATNTLKSIDFTDKSLELGGLVGAYKLAKKYGTNFSKWGDRHVNAILKDPKASTIAKSYAKYLPKNKWARVGGALLTNSIYPALLAYGAGSIINKLKETDKNV